MRIPGRTPAERASPRRRLLVAVLVSIAVNAALGIYALLVPHFGDLQGRVLATSACLTGAGVLAQACLPAIEQRRLRLLSLAGLAASAVAFTMAIIEIWSSSRSVPYENTMGSAFVLAAVGVLISVLALTRLAPRYHLVFPATVLLALIVGGMAVYGIWGDPSSSGFPRSIGVAIVLLAALSVSLPILHRASRDELTGAASSAEIRFCPSCGQPVTPTSGQVECAGCGARFSVEYHAPG